MQAMRCHSQVTFVQSTKQKSLVNINQISDFFSYLTKLLSVSFQHVFAG